MKKKTVTAIILAIIVTSIAWLCGCEHTPTNHTGDGKISAGEEYEPLGNTVSVSKVVPERLRNSAAVLKKTKEVTGYWPTTKEEAETLYLTLGMTSGAYDEDETEVLKMDAVQFAEDWETIVKVYGESPIFVE